MKTVNLIVEGTKDVYFLHEFLLRRFPVFERQSNPIPDNRLKDNPVDLISSDGMLVVHMYWTGGFDKISKLANLTRPKADEDGAFSYGIAFDADYPKTRTNGGFKARRDHLQTILGPSSSDSVFLFPNNSDDGNLEVLMERMVAPSSDHAEFLGVCWKIFSDCVRHHAFHPTSQKSKMNEYTAAFYDGAWDYNGINRGFAVDGLWDWDCHALSPLFGFIRRLLSH